MTSVVPIRIANDRELQPLKPPDVRAISDLLGSSQHALILADDTFAHSFLEEAPITPGAQTRPNLKIQEGCSNRCSFCVIPQTRGNSRSLSAISVLTHVHKLRRRRRKRTRSFRDQSRPLGPGSRSAHSLPPRTFAALVRTILEQTNLPRLRLSSIEPMDWDTDLIALMSEYGGTRLARHAHLPFNPVPTPSFAACTAATAPGIMLKRSPNCSAPPALRSLLAPTSWSDSPAKPIANFRRPTTSSVRSRSATCIFSLFRPAPARAHGRCMPHRQCRRLPSTAHGSSARSRRRKDPRTPLQFIGAELDAITLNTPPALASANRTSALTENFLPVEIAGSAPPIGSSGCA